MQRNTNPPSPTAAINQPPHNQRVQRVQRIPFAALSIGQSFVMHGTAHVKKSPTTAINCHTRSLRHVRVAEHTIVEIAQ